MVNNMNIQVYSSRIFNKQLVLKIFSVPKFTFPYITNHSKSLMLFSFHLQGVLSDGSEIAVKQLSSKSKQGNREFVTEIGMISALQHPNLVKLFGCCIEGNQLLLIYEYLQNNSLARALFGKKTLLSTIFISYHQELGAVSFVFH